MEIVQAGKMGIALAENAALQGADVTLIAGMVTVDLPMNVNVIRIQTFADLQTKLMEEFPQMTFWSWQPRFQTITLNGQMIKKLK